MPIYQLTGKDGKVYQIEGPAGLSKETVQAAILKKAPQAAVAKQKESAIEEIPIVGGVLAPVLDIPLALAEGLGGTAKTFTDLFGAGNAASDFVDDVTRMAGDLRSAGSREDEATARQIQKEAEGKGIWEEVKAAARAFTYSPLETTASVAGSALPFIAAGVATGGAGLLPAASMAGLGVASGAGAIKGDIYDSVYEEFRKAGASEEAASAAAERAQEYGGKNMDQIALGGALGALASATGFSRQIAGTLGKKAAARTAERIAAREGAEVGARTSALRGAARGAAEEAVPEAIQAGQEQFASNLAAQREGFDVDAWKGVAGQAAFEGIASLLLGGYGGAREARQENRDLLIKELKQEFDAMPPGAGKAEVNAAAERFLRRGIPPEKANQIANNIAAEKQAIEERAVELAKAREAAVAARTAGVSPPTEPDISAPPEVDAEEQAAMDRMRAAEITGVEPTPAPSRAARQPTTVTPARAASILSNQAAVSDFAASTGMDTAEAESVLYDIAEEVPGAPTLKYSRRGRPPSASTLEEAGQVGLFGALPDDQRERLSKREEVAQFQLEQRGKTPEELEAERQARADEFTAGQEEYRARNEQYKVDFLNNLEEAVRRAHPANEAYSVALSPDSPKPYKIVGPDGEVFASADNLQDFEAQAMELAPYTPPPISAQEIEPDSLEATATTSMTQELVKEIDAARQRGEIDNNQRGELLARLERPAAYDRFGRPQDNIAKAEDAVRKAMSKFRNATGPAAKAAEVELDEANTKLKKLVTNRITNPIRARLRSMSETRKDEKLGAKVRIKDALKALAKRMVIVVHGGSDFEALNRAKLGTGEPGNLRPLGNGFYGYVVDTTNANDVETAVSGARRYSEKYGRGDKAIHAFRLDMAGAESLIKGADVPSLAGTKTTAEKKYRAALEAADKNPSFLEGIRDERLAREAYVNSVDLVVERLPSGLVEGAVNDLSRLERIGKISIDKNNEELVQTIKKALAEGVEEQREARRELREAKIDLNELQVQKYRKPEAKPTRLTDVKDVEQVVAQITRGWKGPPNVTVVQSTNDITDADIRDAIKRDNATDAEGFVAPDGTIYLIADNLESVERARAVLFHEALGHVGLDRLFRSQLDDVLLALYKGNATLRAQADEWLRSNPDAYKGDKRLVRAVEEVLAERSEAGYIKPNFFKRIAAVIRNFARRVGIKVALSDADVEAILAAAHERVLAGNSVNRLVNSMRYIKGRDRIRPDSEAAKTFLRELGLFSGRELLNMSAEDATNAASRIGIDEEWMDYYRSRRLAAWSQSPDAIKLPQPDMSKYMPELKFSKPKTTKKTAEALDETEADMSVGLRRMEKTTSTYAAAEGLQESIQGRRAKPFVDGFKENYAGMKPAALKAALVTMPTSGILNWFSTDIPSLKEIDDLVQRMVAMKANILKASEPIAEALQEFLVIDENKQLARSMGINRINEMSPDEFKSATDAFANHPAMQELERRILKNSNDTKLAKQVIEDIKALVIADKSAQKFKGDKVRPSPELKALTAKLDKTAIDVKEVALQQKQLVELSRRIRDTYREWDKLGKLEGGHELYKQIRSFYKDMFEAELALLDARVERITDEKEAKRLRDLRADMMREVMDPKEAQKAGDLFADFDANLFSKDYFPFMREGLYWLRVKAASDGTREREFYTFQTAKEMQTAQREVAKRLGVNAEDSEVIEVGYNIDTLQEALKTEDQIMQKIFDLVGKAKFEFEQTGLVRAKDFKDLTDSIYQTWLMTTPERSVRRRFMHAEEVVGQQLDLLQQFSTQATNYANQLSKMAFAGDVRLAVSSARDSLEGRPTTEKAKLDAVISEFDARAESEINPDPQSALVNVLNRASYFYYLTSASTALLQVTSIPIRVVPRLWRDYGFAKGTAMWVKYMKIWNSLGRAKTEKINPGIGDQLHAMMPNIMSSKIVNNDSDRSKLLKRALAVGMERNVLETVQDTLIQNEREVAKRTKTGASKVASDVAAETGKVMGVLFQGMENITRQAAYFMAFELAYDDYKAKNPGVDEQQVFDHAVSTALNTVRDTLGDYSNWERSRLMKNDWTRAVFLFKMHPIVQTKFMVGAFRDIIRGFYPGASPEMKAARAGAFKELMGVTMMAGMFGGLMAMPLYTPLAWALAEGFDDEDDEDVRKLMGMDPRVAYDSDIMFRAWLMDKFGTPKLGDVPLSDILIHGPLAAFTDTELASRVSMDLKSMWFREAVAGDSTADTMIKTAIANIAPGQMLVQIMGAYDNYADGDIYGALRKAMPAFFRSWVAGVQGEAEGIETRKGDMIINKEDITAFDTARALLGFRPMTLARWQDYYITRGKNDKKIEAEKSKILGKLDRMIREGDIKTTEDLREFWANEVEPFNRTYPDPALVITPESMVRSLKGREDVRERTVKGMQLDRKTAPKDYASARPFMPE